MKIIAGIYKRLARFVAWIWRSLAQSKDQISSLALLVGGVWVLLHLDILSEFVAEVRLEQTVKAYKALADATILQVDVTLTNSSKRSATFGCEHTTIREFLPLSKDNATIVRGALAPNTNFDYKAPIMKNLDYQQRLVVPANGSTSDRRFYSVSPFDIDDKSAKVQSVVVMSAYYKDRQVCPRLEHGETIPPDSVVESIFDMEANTSAPSVQQ